MDDHPGPGGGPAPHGRQALPTKSYGSAQQRRGEGRPGAPEHVMRVIDKVVDKLEANLTKDSIVDDGVLQLTFLVDGKSALRRFMTGKWAFDC